jgi:hypothetical protein
MSAYNDIDVQVAGLRYGLEATVETFHAAEEIAFGDPVFGYAGDDVNGYAAHQDTAQIVWDADFVTSNSIDVVVNGVTTTVVFDTDQATTMLAIIAAIEAQTLLAGIDVTRTDISGDDRTLKFFWKGDDIETLTETVTLGASQATGTITFSNSQVFLGIALLSHQESAGVAKYDLNEAMNVLTEGFVWVNAYQAVQANSAAYVVVTFGANLGKFGTAGYDTKSRFRGNTSGAALVALEVRGQN